MQRALHLEHVLMGSDVPDGVPHQPGSAISVSLSGDDEAALRGFYDALAEGGTVIEPLAQAPWGTSSAPASTASAPPGWSTSPAHRLDPPSCLLASVQGAHRPGGPDAPRHLARPAAADATVGELAEPYDVSVQAVSKHLNVLGDAGLVSKSRVAQRRSVHLEAEMFDLMGHGSSAMTEEQEGQA